MARVKGALQQSLQQLPVSMETGADLHLSGDVYTTVVVVVVVVVVGRGEERRSERRGVWHGVCHQRLQLTLCDDDESWW